MRGRITHWNWASHFGFLRTVEGRDYYYDERTIEDKSLLRGLNAGHTGQCVEFHVLRKSLGGKPPLVAIKKVVPVLVDCETDRERPDLHGEKEDQKDVAGDFHDTEETICAQLGFITRWFPDYQYGFLVNGRKSYYFNANDVHDSRLKASLDSGKIRQQVRYLPMPNITHKDTPPARIVEMLREDTHDWLPLPAGNSEYDIGRRLMNDGDLIGAEKHFRNVLNNAEDPARLSALRDLAETLNRGVPSVESASKAFDLIESHRFEFPESEQSRFERMEILYLMKAKKYPEAKEKITRYLVDYGGEPNQRRYFRSLLKAADDKMAYDTDEPSTKEALADFKNAYSRLKIENLSAETFRTVRTFVDSYCEIFSGISLELGHVIDEMSIYAQQADYSGKMNSFATAKGCFGVFQQQLSKMQVEGWTEGSVVVPVLDNMLQRIQDVAERDFQSFVHREVLFGIEHAESDVYDLGEDGRLWLSLRLISSGPLGLPLKDIVIAYGGKPSDQGQTVVEQLRCGDETGFSIVIAPDIEVRNNQSGEITFALSFVKSTVFGDEEGCEISDVVLRYSIRTVSRKLANHYGQYIDNEADGDYFVGRQSLLSYLEGQFFSPNGNRLACIYGMHRSGKSSFISQLKERLRPRDLFYVETVNGGALARATNLIETLCRRLIREVVQEAERRLLWGAADEKVMMEGYAADDWGGRLQYVCEKLSSNGSSVVLRIDEFTSVYDALRRNPAFRDQVENFLDFLKEDVIKKRLMYVILAGQDHMQRFRRAFPDKLVVEPVRLFCLTEPDVVKLALVGLADETGRVLLDDDARARVWELTGGYPKYVQHLLWRITEIVQFVRRINIDDVNEAAVTFWSWKENKNPLLKHVSPTFFEPFAIYDSEEFTNPELLELNYRIAEQSRATGWVRRSDIVEDDADNCLLKQLRERGLIDTDSTEELPDEKIRLRVGLFAEYLRHNLTPRLTVGDFNSSKGGS